MFISQNTYGRYLILSAAAGVLLSLLWDGFRILHLATGKHRNDPPRLVSLFCGDLLFALISAVTMILLTYYANYGRFRWFAFAAAGIGFVSWRVTGGRLLMACAERLIALTLALLRVLFRPLVLLFGWIRKKLTAASRRGASRKTLKKHLKIVKNRFSLTEKRRKRSKKESKTI